MKRLTTMACAGLIAAAVATPSHAADMARPVYQSPPAAYVAPFSWDGFYLGINGGYGWGKADITNAIGTFQTNSQDGYVLGGTAGFNAQSGVWVFGIEGDLDFAWIKGNTVNSVTCFGGTCEVKDSFIATLRGRVGYAFDHFLPFLTAGGAMSKLKLTTPFASVSDTNFGWTTGAGVEYAFSGTWSAKAEYLYVDLGTANCDVGVCGIATDIKAKANLIRLGVNYHF